MIKVLSLGAGVQSSVVFLMSCCGELPKIDAAIFADVGWEPKGVYKHLDWLEEKGKTAGIPVLRVKREPGLRSSILESRALREGEHTTRFASMPMHVLNEDGTRGIMRRQCTQEFKIEPIEKAIRYQLLGLKPKQRAPVDAVEHWYGISADEMRRVRNRTNHWEIKQYPLVNVPTQMLPKPMTRKDCIKWFEERFPGRSLTKSSCIGCPFHAADEWRAIKADPEAWADAVDFDRRIRTMRCGMRGGVYLHRSCKPLDEVDLSTPEERGQMNLWQNECLGMCGV